ncbi:HtaA domain-containing protein [Streptomyces sp. NPDC050264]|uniref:HtaA domain-containing protein n=1 Tax=Streptomyces sp. NPDC050264 TaxID=3155038 RepID=UPI003431E99F
MSAAARSGVLSWGVKASFVHYVRAVAAGTCEAVDGAELDADTVFRFPLTEADRNDDGWTLRFEGGARFWAHHGFLDVELRRLALDLTSHASGGTLSAVNGDGDRVVLGTLPPAAPAERGGVIRWSGLVPCLTEAGAELFGTVYPPGSELASLDALVLLDS